MNTTIRPEFLSPDDFMMIWTDDEDCSDSDPLADHAAFVAYLHADSVDVDASYPIRWIADRESDRRVIR